jgi:hypothetical protein
LIQIREETVQNIPVKRRLLKDCNENWNASANLSENFPVSNLMEIRFTVDELLRAGNTDKRRHKHGETNRRILATSLFEETKQKPTLHNKQ